MKQITITKIAWYKTVFLCSALLLGVARHSTAQTLEDFSPLLSSGSLPEIITRLSSEVYTEEKSKIDKTKTTQEQSTENKYYLETTFSHAEFLKSGKVTFGDPVSRYISEVAAEIFKGKPEVFSTLRFCLIKSTSVNAFAFDNGTIAVTVGMMAQLENEAQLAFVLAHELAHFEEKHVLSEYHESAQIDARNPGYSRSTKERNFLAKASYSREVETEADEIALEVMAQSGYSLQTLPGLYDVLIYSYLPFDEIDFDTTFFNTDFYQLPGEYFLNKIKEITGREDIDEAKSSHPSAARRRATTIEYIQSANNTGKSDFLVSEKRFTEARDLSRFELSRIYLLERDYVKAFYNNYLLLKKFPNNLYVEKSFLKSLYSLTKYKNRGAKSAVIAAYKNQEGSSQQAYHLFDKIKNKELNILAVRQSWILRKKYPNDAVIAKINEDLVRSLLVEHNMPHSVFKKAKQVEIVQQIDKEQKEKVEVEDKELSKYDKIRKKKADAEVASSVNYELYAFVDFMKDPDFKDIFEQEQAKLDAERAIAAQTGYDAVLTEEVLKKNNLGAQRLLVLDPVYTIIDKNKNGEVRHLDSEASLIAYHEKIMSIAEKTGVELQLISTNSLKVDGVEEFNDYTRLNDWIQEAVEHHDASVSILPAEQEYMNHLIDKYGTEWVALTGVISAMGGSYKKEVLFALGSMLNPVLLPVAMFRLAQRKYETYHYIAVFNLKSGRVEYKRVSNVPNMQSNDYLNATIYDNFMHIVTQKKSSEK